MSLVTVLSYAIAVIYTAVFVYMMFVWNKEDRR
jgi:NADH:ubiquinone oxidoreductase subunit 6 (subunit J)